MDELITIYYCDARIRTNVGERKGLRDMPPRYHWVRGIVLPGVPLGELNETHLSRCLRDMGYELRKDRQEIISAGTHAIVEVVQLKTMGICVVI